MLEEILPATAVVISTPGDREAKLYPEEERLIVNSVAKRRAEFTTVRACARDALDRLGAAAAPILSDPKGAPQWPDGIVGSITHCDGYRACALAWSEDLMSIGIDAEPNQPLPSGLLPDIGLPREREWISGVAGHRTDVNWDRLLFCIKESIYKTWYPLTQRWLGFEDAEVEIDAERGTFSARVCVPAPIVAGRSLDRFVGRWLARDGLVLAAIAMPG